MQLPFAHSACDKGASCSDYRIKDNFMLSITSLRADNISIGELSKQSGVNIETIRYYEGIKMLPAPPRTPSGRRGYGPPERRPMAFTPRPPHLAFALPASHPLFALRLSPPPSLAHL